MIDQPVTFGTWSPENYDGKFRGPMTLKEALAKSINTVAAQLADQVTPEAVVQTAKRMGINSPLGANPSIALGTSEVTLLEMTGAYAPFSNGGFAVLPFVVQRVRTPDGTVIFERTGSGLGRVASIESVALMNDMLQATVEMGTATRASLAGWPAGGKTGTSQNFRDAWFIGYTANLTAGVWVGNDSDAPTKHASGGTMPAEIWAKFMTKAHEGVPVAQLPGNRDRALSARAAAAHGRRRRLGQLRRRQSRRGGGERSAHAQLDHARRQRRRATGRASRNARVFQKAFGGSVAADGLSVSGGLR